MSNILHYTSTNGKIVPIGNNCGEIGNKIILHTYREGVGTIVFRDELQIIPVGYFKGAENLETITIPKSVGMIEKGAFEDCHNLKKVKLQEGLLAIGERAFSRTNLDKIVIPSSVIIVGSYAFSYCSKLVKVDFRKPKSNCLIGSRCFHSSPTEIEHAWFNNWFSRTSFDRF